MNTMCSHGNDRASCSRCAVDAETLALTVLRKAAHQCDLVAYEAMGLVLSMLDMGLMPVAMLAIANDLQKRFASASRELNACGIRATPTPIIPAVNPGSNK